MKTVYKTVRELIEHPGECPLPLDVIPNRMGINLCSVEAVSWTTRQDGQLTSLMIYFLPDETPA